MWKEQENNIISYRIEEGSPILSEIWNKRDDIRRKEHESFVRWLAHYGVDIKEKVTCLLSKKGQGEEWIINITVDAQTTPTTPTTTTNTTAFRLFLYGTYLIVKPGISHLPILNLTGPESKDNDNNSKDLYLFAYEYECPVTEPYKTGPYSSDYRDWLGLPANSDSSKASFLPTIQYADRLMRDFAFALIPRTYEKEDDVKKALKAKLPQKPNLEISDCHVCLGTFSQAQAQKGIELPRVIFSPRTAPTEEEGQYTQEIGVRMKPGLILNPVDWNLSDKFRRIEQERFLWWLLDGKEGYLCKENNNNGLYAYQIAPQRMTLVLCERNSVDKSALMECREKWYKSPELATSERVIVQGKPESSAKEIKIEYFENKTNGKKEWKCQSFPNIKTMADQYGISKEKRTDEEQKEYRKKITTTLANEIFSGSPITHTDWNAMDDIRRFQHEQMVFTLVGNGVPSKSRGFQPVYTGTSKEILEGELFLNGFVLYTKKKILEYQDGQNVYALKVEYKKEKEKEKCYKIQRNIEVSIIKDNAIAQLTEAYIPGKTLKILLERFNEIHIDERKKIANPDPAQIWTELNYGSNMVYVRRGQVFHGQLIPDSIKKDCLVREKTNDILPLIMSSEDINLSQVIQAILIKNLIKNTDKITVKVLYNNKLENVEIGKEIYTAPATSSNAKTFEVYLVPYYFQTKN